MLVLRMGQPEKKKRHRPFMGHPKVAILLEATSKLHKRLVRPRSIQFNRATGNEKIKYFKSIIGAYWIVVPRLTGLFKMGCVGIPILLSTILIGKPVNRQILSYPASNSQMPYPSAFGGHIWSIYEGDVQFSPWEMGLE